jgi:hypothetical protein
MIEQDDKAAVNTETIADDYDSPWKEAVEHYFPEFMEFYFPERHLQKLTGQRSRCFWIRSYVR